MDPLVLAIDDFFTPDECDRYIAMVNTPHGKHSPPMDYETRSKTVGKDALSKSQRTSTTLLNLVESLQGRSGIYIQGITIVRIGWN